MKKKELRELLRQSGNDLVLADAAIHASQDVVQQALDYVNLSQEQFRLKYRAGKCNVAYEDSPGWTNATFMTVQLRRVSGILDQWDEA